MEAKEIFKSMENAPAILAKYGFCAFEFGKTVNLPIDGVNTEVAIFWPYEDTGIFPKFGRGMWYVTADGWRVAKTNKSECLDGVWVQYGKDNYKRIAKIF